MLSRVDGRSSMPTLKRRLQLMVNGLKAFPQVQYLVRRKVVSPDEKDTNETMPHHDSASSRFMDIAELVIHLMSFLPPIDLARLRRVDHRFKTLITTSRSLQIASFTQSEGIAENQFKNAKELQESLRLGSTLPDCSVWKLWSRKLHGNLKPITLLRIQRFTKNTPPAELEEWNSDCSPSLAFPVVLNTALFTAWSPLTMMIRQEGGVEKFKCWTGAPSCFVRSNGGYSYCLLSLHPRFEAARAIPLTSSCWSMFLTQPAVKEVFLVAGSECEYITRQTGITMEDVRIALSMLDVDLSSPRAGAYDTGRVRILINHVIIPSPAQSAAVEEDIKSKGAYLSSEGEWVTHHVRGVFDL